MAGRPSKLNEETQTRLIEAIKKGATYELACNYARITYQTFRNWIERGEQAQSGEYFEFFEAIKAAEGEAAFEWLDMIEKAAPNNWQAAAWKLERRFSQDYGKQVIEHQGNKDKPIETVSTLVLDFTGKTSDGDSTDK